MSDDQLSARSGFNTGVEPCIGFVVDKATQAKPVVMKGAAEFTLLEGNAEDDRTLVASVVGTKIQWPSFPDPADTVHATGYETRYYNSFNEVILLNASPGLVGPASATQGCFPVTLDGLFIGTIVMVEGEKITIKRASNGEQAGGLGDLAVYPSYLNIKKKPKPYGGGGQTDGNCVVLRERITASGVVVGPPPGKAWRPVPSVGKIFSGLAGHFGATGDNPALINTSLIDENGVERFVEQDSVQPQFFTDLDKNFFEPDMTVLSYPNKLKYKLFTDAQNPLPAGRVMLMTAMMEFDKPEDP